MKTKEELKELSDAVSKAVYAYHNAIAENLKESGKEHNVLGVEEKGLRLDIEGGYDEITPIVVDKIRNGEHDLIEVHVCEEDYEEKDYWSYISVLGDAEDYVLDNIEW